MTPLAPTFYEGFIPPILEALRDHPQSATELAETLRQPNVTALRTVLEHLDRRGLVKRGRTGSGPWVWEAVDGC